VLGRLTREAEMTGMMSKRWRWVFSATLDRFCGSRWFGSPGMGDGWAGDLRGDVGCELELWREGAG
jgi:hypothetical protein